MNRFFDTRGRGKRKRGDAISAIKETRNAKLHQKKGRRKASFHRSDVEPRKKEEEERQARCESATFPEREGGWGGVAFRRSPFLKREKARGGAKSVGKTKIKTKREKIRRRLCARKRVGRAVLPESNFQKKTRGRSRKGGLVQLSTKSWKQV